MSKSGHILYLMVHWPFVWWWKVGITGKSAAHRAKSLDKAMPGRPYRVWAAIVPGAYHIEQWLHRELKGSNIVWYRGDGRTEWFWFWVAPFVWAVMVGITLLEVAAGALIAGYFFGFDGLEWFFCFVTVLWEWAVIGIEFLKKLI